MAESVEPIVIGGFEREALSQLFEYIGGDEKSFRHQVSNYRSSNNIGTDDLQEQTERYEEAAKKYKEAHDSYWETTTKAWKAYHNEDYSKGVRKERHAAMMLAKQEMEIQKEICRIIEEKQDKQKKEIANQQELNKLIEEGEKLRNKARREIRNSEEDAESIYIAKHKGDYEKLVERQKKTSGYIGAANGYETLHPILAQSAIFRQYKNYLNQAKSLGILSPRFGAGTAIAMNGISKGASFVANGKMDVSSIANGLSSSLSKLGPWGAVGGGIVEILKTAFEEYSKVNTAAAKFTRTVGGGAKAITDLEKNITNAASSFSEFGGRAYDAAKILENMAEYSGAIGRNTQYLSNMDIKALQDLKDYGIGSDVLSQLDTFGLSLNTMSKNLTDIYSNAGQKGLNAKAVTDTVTKNLKMAQNYTFAGGRRALERMAEKSVALKYNIEAAARFADKVSTLEGATQAAANLSVLGGDFARMGNPLSMLYGGLQDTERLNDMMLNMTKNMASWDSEHGEMRISAYNKQRIRAAADAMGVDYGEMINQTMNQGRRNMIDNQMSSNITDSKTREFIRNIATIDSETGKAKVRIKNSNNEYEEKLVSALTEADKKSLEEESKNKKLAEGATIGDLLNQTRTTQEKLDDIIGVLKARLMPAIIRIFNLIDSSHLLGSGGKNQIDANTSSMSKSQQSDYETLKRVKSNGFGSATSDEIQVLNRYGFSGAITMSDDELAKLVTEKKAHGGSIRGKGTSTSDSIPAMLSDGEFVMNAKAANKHLPTLQAWNAEGFSNGTILPIRAGQSQTNPLIVAPVSNNTNVGNSNGSMKIEPINLNINGKIDLTSNGNSTSIDAKKLLEDSRFIHALLVEIQKSLNYRLDREKVQQKFPI